jgi:cell division protein ZapE
VPDRLVDRRPEVPAGRLLAELVPPPRFTAVRFHTYRPDPDQPTQRAALDLVSGFAARLDSASAAPAPARRWFRRGSGAPAGPAGVYLDGGFGVGKTHLLAALWHAAPAPKAYGTFVELTALVGALGFAPTVEALGGHRLLAIDEFELDDPGDTVLVSTLLTRLVERGVRLAATSNTQPEDLGAGRFNAEDFLREIQALAARFATVRVDGEDYRHRGLPTAPPPRSDAEVRAAVDPPGGTLDEFPALCAHLATLHPSRYGALVDGVRAVGLLGVTPVADQATALRLVVLVDRLYDRDVPVTASGAPLTGLFPAEFLTGPHRKKYQRAVSRLVALSRGAAG